MDDAQLSVELLCGHHELDTFDCGHPESNSLARGLLDQVRESREWRYRHSFLAVAAVDGESIVGIAAACDLHLDGDMDAGGLPVHGKCLFYYLIATDRSDGGKRMAALKRLRNEMDDIQRLLLPSGAYIGELAMPDRADDPLHVKRLIAWLERQEFRPLGSKPFLWFRPREEPPDDGPSDDRAPRLS